MTWTLGLGISLAALAGTVCFPKQWIDSSIGSISDVSGSFFSLHIFRYLPCLIRHEGFWESVLAEYYVNR